MITKLFEVRDKGTFIPIIAIKLGSRIEAERYLASRAGYGANFDTQSEYVFVGQIDGGYGRLSSNACDWSGLSRTMEIAHEYINKNFGALAPGAVIDVEFILGETSEPKKSESETS